MERHWRSVKYEEAYLRACESVAELCTRIGDYFRFYNPERRNQSLGSALDEANSGQIILSEAS